MWRGVRRLLLLDTPSPVRQVQRDLDNAAKLASRANPHGSWPPLLEDCARLRRTPMITAAGGRRGTSAVRPAAKLFRERWRPPPCRLLGAVRGVLAVCTGCSRSWRISRRRCCDPAPTITTQLNALVGPGFVNAAGASSVADVARYVECRRAPHREAARGPGP